MLLTRAHGARRPSSRLPNDWRVCLFERPICRPLFFAFSLIVAANGSSLPPLPSIDHTTQQRRAPAGSPRPRSWAASNARTPWRSSSPCPPKTRSVASPLSQHHKRVTLSHGLACTNIRQPTGAGGAVAGRGLSARGARPQGVSRLGLDRGRGAGAEGQGGGGLSVRLFT